MYSMDISVPEIFLTSLLTTGLNLWLGAWFFSKKEKQFLQIVEKTKGEIISGFPKQIVYSTGFQAKRATCSKCGHLVARFSVKEDGSVECANCAAGSF